jgi:kynurenine 3-monooxygenase
MRHLLLILSCLLQESGWAFQCNRTRQARDSPLFSSASAAAVDSKHAIVVGGGPVGLATALTLSNAPHFYRVTLLEQTKGTGVYDPTKAYLYNVNARGQEWTQQFPAVQTLLTELGSSTSMGGIVIVPADPKEPIPERKLIATAPVSASTTAVNYWIPRHTMTVLLEDVIAEQEAKRRDGSLKAGKVELFYSKECRSIQTSDGLVEVTVQDTKDPNVRFQETYKGDLLIGADGMNSAVRNCLADETATKTTWLNVSPKQFRLKIRKSPASNLRMRVLQFPPGFEIPNVDGKILHTSSEAIYAIRSAFKGPRNYLSLGLLPIKDSSMVRPTNVITRPNHELWSLKTGAETKAWFTRAFPRLQIDAMIPDEEWDRFAKSQGTAFPPCQYCPKLQVSHPSGQVGVALVGDSLHAFPPDIGQGINAVSVLLSRWS